MELFSKLTCIFSFQIYSYPREPPSISLVSVLCAVHLQRYDCLFSIRYYKPNPIAQQSSSRNKPLFSTMLSLQVVSQSVAAILLVMMLYLVLCSWRQPKNHVIILLQMVAFIPSLLIRAVPPSSKKFNCESCDTCEA